MNVLRKIDLLLFSFLIFATMISGKWIIFGLVLFIDLKVWRLEKYLDGDKNETQT